MKNAILIFLTIMMFSVKSFSCSFTPETFCQTIKINPDNLIVSGKIISVDSNGLFLEIIDVFRGQETKDTIRIWDGTDFDCNGPFDMSVQTIGQINDSIIISLPQITNIENTWDVLGDYRNPDPYTLTSQLKFQNGFASGLIQGDAIAPPEVNLLSIEYTKLKESIVENEECKDLILNSDDVILDNDIQFNNPIHSTLEIHNIDPNAVNALSLFSLEGTLVFRQEMDYKSNLSIDLMDAVSGLYILRVEQNDNTFRSYKLIKY